MKSVMNIVCAGRQSGRGLEHATRPGRLCALTAVSVLLCGLWVTGLSAQTTDLTASTEEDQNAAGASSGETAVSEGDYYYGSYSEQAYGGYRASANVYRTSFLRQQFDHAMLVPFGYKTLYGLQLLRPERRGLRMMIPRHQGDRKPTVGFIPLFKLHGDFEIAAAYKTLTIDKPTAGAGAGANLYILAEGTLHSASLRRCVTPDGADAFFIHVATRDDAGKRQAKYQCIPATTTSGELRLKRTGSTLQFLVDEDEGEGCRELHRVEFGTSTIGVIRVGTTTDGSPTSTENLWREFAVQADRLERVDIPLFRNRQASTVIFGGRSGTRGAEMEGPPAYHYGYESRQPVTEEREAVLKPEDPRRPLYLINADGSGLRQLLSMKDYTATGSPDWSHDGAKIAFDAWKSTQGENFRSAHVFIANADGSEPQDLGAGAMPSFSPDANRIAFSCYSPPGVWIMNSDGTSRELVDSEGWSVRWSPNGEKVAYVSYNEGGKANLCVLDLIERQRQWVLAEEHRHYVAIGINFDWSPDGKRLAFRGVREDGESELVFVDAEGSQHGYDVRCDADIKIDLSWSPDGRRLLFPSHNVDTGGLQIYELEVDAQEPPTPLKGQPRQRANMSTAWSPDGEKILFSSGPLRN